MNDKTFIISTNGLDAAKLSNLLKTNGWQDKTDLVFPEQEENTNNPTTQIQLISESVQGAVIIHNNKTNERGYCGPLQIAHELQEKYGGYIGAVQKGYAIWCCEETANYPDFRSPTPEEMVDFVAERSSFYADKNIATELESRRAELHETYLNLSYEDQTGPVGEKIHKEINEINNTLKGDKAAGRDTKDIDDKNL